MEEHPYRKLSENTIVLYMTRLHVIMVFPSNSPTGDKYTKAREWGIFCVNAKWLGDIVTSKYMYIIDFVGNINIHVIKAA